MYDLLLKNGEVTDPAQGLAGTLDIAVGDGRIAALAHNIPEDQALRVISLAGKIVVPGLIDAHCHPAGDVVGVGVDPDEIGIASGVTTVGDAGSTGAGNLRAFRHSVVEPARTAVFCFLNLGTMGLASMPEIKGEGDIDLAATRAAIEENRDIVKGIKIRAVQSIAQSVGMAAVESAKSLAASLGLPVMMHIGDSHRPVDPALMARFTRDAVALLERGDVISHFLTSMPGALIAETGEVCQELWEARERGVILDACHGQSNFSFAVARQALAQGLLPDVISTDLSRASLKVVQSLLVTMSKFLNLGLTLEQVVAMATANAARALGEAERRGSLAPGRGADVTVLEIVDGDYCFVDGSAGNNLRGSLLLEPRLVLKGGVEMPCSSRYQPLAV